MISWNLYLPVMVSSVPPPRDPDIGAIWEITNGTSTVSPLEG